MQSDICGGGQNMEVVNLWYFMISVYKRQIQTSGDYKKIQASYNKFILICIIWRIKHAALCKLVRLYPF